jgi:hypothetical protein
MYKKEKRKINNLTEPLRILVLRTKQIKFKLTKKLKLFRLRILTIKLTSNSIYILKK